MEFIFLEGITSYTNWIWFEIVGEKPFVYNGNNKVHDNFFTYSFCLSNPRVDWAIKLSFCKETKEGLFSIKWWANKTIGNKYTDRYGLFQTIYITQAISFSATQMIPYICDGCLLNFKLDHILKLTSAWLFPELSNCFIELHLFWRQINKCNLQIWY